MGRWVKRAVYNIRRVYTRVPARGHFHSRTSRYAVNFVTYCSDKSSSATVVSRRDFVINVR